MVYYYCMLKKQRGFTLIELMVAITIVAVLSGIGFTIYAQAQIVARDSRRKLDLKSFKTSFELFYEKHRYFPSYNSTTLGGSDSGNWPNLFEYVYVSGNPAVDSTERTFDYIAQMPLDPINNSNYHYSYYVQASGQGYLVCVSLENSRDPDYNPVLWGTGQNFCERNP